MKYSELKKLCGFEKLTKDNIEEWAGISHAIHSIGFDYFKYFEHYLSESDNLMVREIYRVVKEQVKSPKTS
jgi:hypothetical protein